MTRNGITEKNCNQIPIAEAMANPIRYSVFRLFRYFSQNQNATEIASSIGAYIRASLE
jgi:hypothetical protein